MLQHLVFGGTHLPVPGEKDVLLDRPPSAETAPQDWTIVNEGASGSIDLNTRELLTVGLLLAGLVALGVWPQTVSAALYFALIGVSL